MILTVKKSACGNHGIFDFLHGPILVFQVADKLDMARSKIGGIGNDRGPKTL